MGNMLLFGAVAIKFLFVLLYTLLIYERSFWDGSQSDTAIDQGESSTIDEGMHS